jgi:hypothetical protein
MPQRSRRDQTAELRLEPLFKAYFGGTSVVVRVSSDEELASLLRQLDVPADSAAVRCFAHVDCATARAVEAIAGWMSYLPKDCVKAMVRDGWHWST